MRKKHIENTGIQEYLNTCKNDYTVTVIKNNKKIHKHIRCGTCKECIRHKTKIFQLRLIDEYLDHKVECLPIAVKMKIDKENIENLKKVITEKDKLKPYEIINKIATIAIRRFNENYRKSEKVSPRHWLITDTENEEIIIRGIIFDYNWPTITKKWKYGEVKIQLIFVRKAILNIAEYLEKRSDDKNNEFRPKIFTSKMIGKGEPKNQNEIEIIDNEYEEITE